MAQIRHPLFVSITGKIDNMVFYRRNGKVFLRRLPVRKKRKPSESQLSHRRQFTAVIAFLPGAKIHISVAGVEGRCREYADE